jgi:hypothetical protein
VAARSHRARVNLIRHLSGDEGFVVQDAELLKNIAMSGLNWGGPPPIFRTIIFVRYTIEMKSLSEKHE